MSGLTEVELRLAALMAWLAMNSYRAGAAVSSSPEPKR